MFAVSRLFGSSFTTWIASLALALVVALAEPSRADEIEPEPSSRCAGGGDDPGGRRARTREGSVGHRAAFPQGGNRGARQPRSRSETRSASIRTRGRRRHLGPRRAHRRLAGAAHGSVRPRHNHRAAAHAVLSRRHQRWRQSEQRSRRQDGLPAPRRRPEDLRAVAGPELRPARRDPVGSGRLGGRGSDHAPQHGTPDSPPRELQRLGHHGSAGHPGSPGRTRCRGCGEAQCGRPGDHADSQYVVRAGGILGHQRPGDRLDFSPLRESLDVRWGGVGERPGARHDRGSARRLRPVERVDELGLRRLVRRRRRTRSVRGVSFGTHSTCPAISSSSPPAPPSTTNPWKRPPGP